MQTKYSFGQALFIGLFVATFGSLMVLAGWWMIVQSLLWAVSFHPDIEHYQSMGLKLVLVGGGMLAVKQTFCAMAGTKFKLGKLTALLLIGGAILNALY